ncbi:MAG: VOC family protein [Acidobacteria bacterium]|nr:VOC family protein [Acidobacteriota bacterium]
MNVFVRAASASALAAGIAVALNGGASIQAQGQGQPPASTIEPIKFHHVHLNSVDPEAAAAYYPKPFAKTATKTTFNGQPAVKTGHIYILFNKVPAPPTNELTGPQTSVWHFGWNTPNSREYNANFRKAGLTIAQMWNGSDEQAQLVDLSGDVPTVPGSGFPTQEQVLELRAKGAKADPTTVPGGFGYLRGPDGVMIENAQSGNEERFNHVHMYHEHPACAMEWYATHLGAKMPQARGGGRGAAAGPVPATSSDCANPRTVYSPPTFPSFAKGGFVREPSGGVNFDDIAILIRPWPGGGLAPTRGHLYDHWAVSTADLNKTVARLKSEGVKFLEEIHPWGTTRAAMIEGPDRIAIEIVEEK